MINEFQLDIYVFLFFFRNIYKLFGDARLFCNLKVVHDILIYNSIVIATGSKKDGLKRKK